MRSIDNAFSMGELLVTKRDIWAGHGFYHSTHHRASDMSAVKILKGSSLIFLGETASKINPEEEDVKVFYFLSHVGSISIWAGESRLNQAF